MSENGAVSLKHESQVDLNIDHILADEPLRHRLFPVTRKRIFLAHAGVAPLPGLTIDALKHEADRAGIAQEGTDFIAEVEAIRRISARLSAGGDGFNPFSLSFSRTNASTGVLTQPP